MAEKGIPPINGNQPIVDPKTGRGQPAFILIINQLIGKIINSTSAALAALLASAPASTTLDVNGTYGAGVDIELGELSPDPTGVYGDASHYAKVTVDEYGRVTEAEQLPAAQGVAVVGGATTVSDVTTINFTSGATVTAGGAGEANVAITGGGGGGQPWYFDPPHAADFTLSNPGCGDMILTDTANSGLCVDCPPGFSGALQNALALEASPGAGVDWTLTFHAYGGLHLTEYIGFGLVLYNSTTSQMITFYHTRTYGAAPSIAVCYWNSNTSFSSDQFTENGTGPFMDWRRVVYSAAANTYTFQVSTNGEKWSTVLTLTATAFMPVADMVGLVAGANNSAKFLQFTVDNYSVV